jgi:hypothetical protein
MKTIILILLSFFIFSVKSQNEGKVKLDKISFNTDVSLVVSKYILTGWSSTFTGYTTYQSQELYLDYSLEKETEKFTPVNVMVHFGVNFPLVSKENWSVLLRLNAGIGSSIGSALSEKETIKRMRIDFPSYISYRRKIKSNIYSVHVGYKYVMPGFIKYHQFVSGLGMDFSEKSSFSVDIPLNSTKFYSQYSDGTTEEMIKLLDIFSISYILRF